MDASPGGWKQRSFTYQATVYIRECLCPIPIGHITETRNDHPEVLDSIRLHCPACATRWRLVLTGGEVGDWTAIPLTRVAQSEG